MKNNKKQKFQLSEKQLGYAMVLPSLLLVIVVVLWPVAQSFYNSLFDYRLNDPTRSQLMLRATIDLERYVDNYFYIGDQLESLANNADSKETTDTINKIQQDIESYHSKLISDEEMRNKVEKIDEMLMNYTPVKDSELKYSELENDFAVSYREALTSHSATLKDIAESSTNEQLSQQLQQSSDLLASTAGNILKSNFIGLSNYGKYLKDQRMWKAMGNTAFFTVISVAFELVLGLAIALLINRAFKGRGIIRASVLIPWAIPTAVAAMMWGFLYDGQSGIVAHYLEVLHLIPGASWLLTTSDGGMFSIILADVWKTTPYMALLLLAGLQTIPQSLYEASSVDGANKIHQFWRITLPLLKSSILVALLFRTLDAFRVFDLIYVLTGGGPANATESISVYAYKTLFAQQNFGEGSVLSVIVFISVAIISLVYVKLIGSDLFEGRTK
ncbi:MULTISPECIES: carbohydrate ABC transporter permease [Virgibacillus]|uniref:carbohydrate ABC transporter permease n=1 Tax=Virgibacillus TaxID=84406 RepID=UPI00045CF5BF|nr:MULTISPECIES: sugar ABC transporter permease [Virgibacillus]AIF44432.1 ABC transporter permease [Virgibacillus sp. SK37]CDQ31225.1 Trehalose transport system permease protein SugA [Virgibacillus halodenitrificans]